MDELVYFSEDGLVKVVFDWCGEGRNGDYNPRDPDDTPLFRLDLFRKRLPNERWPAEYGEDSESEPGDWIFLTGGSFLTALPISTPKTAVDRLMSFVLPALSSRLFDFGDYQPVCQVLCDSQLQPEQISSEKQWKSALRRASRAEVKK